MRVFRVIGTERRVGVEHNVEEKPRIEGNLSSVLSAAFTVIEGPPTLTEADKAFVSSLGLSEISEAAAPPSVVGLRCILGRPEVTESAPRPGAR